MSLIHRSSCRQATMMEANSVNMPSIINNTMLTLLAASEEEEEEEEEVAVAVLALISSQRHLGRRHGCWGPYDREKSSDIYDVLLYKSTDRWFKSWMQ